ncbi:hypothetical protein N0V93_002206 [Gnomoniopsis smithogilvyi]|uniref:Rhodopsin domain-containing protein n=1 Tax=Gnomoniopsis smithogilvyi TaxID=1191159 RepID=A0A9W8YUW1_9PEZI|nr:hypothetical protein N0V93_002206 [Gnomoniopsis smithogilvyi]
MGFSWDDWLSLGGLIFVVIFGVVSIITVPYGIGKHSWAVEPTNVWKIMRTGFFQAADYIIVHWFIKMSILLFYKRVFTLNIRWFKYSVYTLAAYTTGWFISCLIAVIFQCVPPSRFWTQYDIELTTPPTGFCGVKYPPFVIASSALNSVGDVVIFTLPIAMLWKLQLKRLQKFALFLVFATGAFSIAASFIRLSQTHKATELNADTTWIIGDLYMWTLVEAGVGLICSCLPVIGPLFGLVREKMTSYLASLSTQKGLNSNSKGSSNFGYQYGRGKLGMGHRIDSETALGHDKRGGIVRTDSFRMDTQLRSGAESLHNGAAFPGRRSSVSMV